MIRIPCKLLSPTGAWPFILTIGKMPIPTTQTFPMSGTSVLIRGCVAMNRQLMTADEYEAYLAEGITPPDGFRPAAFYNPDGDCIEFFASNEAFKAKRIDNLLTVYVGRESNEVVGSLIKGVSAIFQAGGGPTRRADR